MNKLVSIVSFIVVLVVSGETEAQEHISILSAPENWNSEIINFPLSFAPEINFNGFEDIRFAPGWSNPESTEFWTYHFSWVIDTVDFSDRLLSETMDVYYDGLSRAVLNESTDTLNRESLDPTLSLFIATKDGFKGKVRIFDAFFTKDYITLYVHVKPFYCTSLKQQIVAFDISPRHFDDSVWELFDSIRIVEKCD